jgi:hypothetical protein
MISELSESESSVISEDPDIAPAPHQPTQSHNLHPNFGLHPQHLLQELWSFVFYSIYLFAYSLLNNMVSSQDNMAWMVGWLLTIYRRCGREWLWPSLRYYPDICLEGQKETHEKPQSGQSGWRLRF